MRHYHLLFIISLLFAAFLSPSHSQTYPHSPPPFAPDNDCLSEKFFSCGPHISDLRFPFWEDSTPNTCLTQHPGFNLTCVAGDYAVIRIEGVEFRVLHVDQRELTMNLTRNDLFLNPCSVPEIRATKMKPSYFAYNLPRVARLNLLYACSNADGDDVPSFTCSGDDDHHRVVYANETRLRSVSRQAGECREGTVGALVSRENLRRIEVGELEVIEGLKLGFEVKYMNLVKCAMDCKTTKNVHPHCRFDSHSEFQCADSGEGGTSKIKVIIAVNGLVMGALLVLCFTVYYGRRNKSLLSKSNKRDQDIEGFISNNESLTAKRYKFSEVKKMTKSFKYKLGQGGCGEVYKGELKDGRFVAVKLLNSSRSDGQEFINEVVSISRTSHVNIVTLLGFCFEGQKRALVYEFMPNGSLEKFVYSNEGASQATPNLEREKMIEIATGIARGLEYLHRGCNTRILHFDIKPHNILLDEDLRPKISDFGLAKLCSNNESCVSLLNARGTMGYIAPEVCSRNFGEVSSKSDVYSYGMMILEMVGGRKNINIGASRSSKVYFPNWIYKHIKFGSDLRMLGDMTKEQNELARKMIIVGLWCIQIAPSDRPSMSKVIEMLEGSLDSLRIPPKPTLVSSESPENSHIDLSLMDSLTTSMLYAKG